MGGKESRYTGEILCPKCPLTPIISIFQNEHGVLSCEYKCPLMHFGTVPFSDINKDKENKHGVKCDLCQKGENEQNKIKVELSYCGTCRQFICEECRPKHAKERSNHKVLVPKAKILYTCLEHGNKFTGYCFTCLISICKDCTRHEKHCKKLFTEFYPEKEYLDTIKYYTNDLKEYYKAMGKMKNINNEVFARYKEKCNLLISFVKYLQSNFEEKESLKELNGETLINFLNICSFNYILNIEDLEEKNGFLNYCKNHLILSNKPISDICTFSKTKSDYLLGKLTIKEIRTIDISVEERPKYFKFSPINDKIIFTSGNNLYFIGLTPKSKHSKISKNEKISSFNIINYNVLCICSDKVELYELIKDEPYYKEKIELPDLNILDDKVLEIEGDLDKFLVLRTSNELLVVEKNKNKKNKEYEITANTNLEDINKIYNIEKEEYIDDENDRFDYYYGYSKKKVKKTITKNKLTTIKGVYKDYIILIEGGKITVRNKKLKVESRLSSFTDVNCIIHNGSILVPNDNNIQFFSIPNLECVSVMNVTDSIISLNIMNKKTFIVVEEKYIEQYEVNTWKKLSHQMSFDAKISNMFNIYVIGAKDKFILYDKDKSTFFVGEKIGDKK